jgi:outer membrane receptor protein involved in Fe transport
VRNQIPPALAVALFLAALHALPASAQDGNANENTVVYDEDFFARYSVNNAEDMLRLIPGVPTILDTRAEQQERGFGTAGAQVLINGRRFPGKANEINTNLRRIAPDSVLRVELIRGVSGDIAVRSGGLLVNLVLHEGAGLGGTGSWELNARFNDKGDKGLDGLLSYNGVWRQISYSLGIERNLWSPPAGDARWTQRFHDEFYFHPTGELAETRPQAWQRDHEKWIFTGGLIYDFTNRDRLELNAFYQTLGIQEKETTPFVRFDTDGVETLRATDFRSREFDFFSILELSGQYEAELGPGGFTGLILHRRDNRPLSDYRNRITAEGTTELNRSNSVLKRGEDILRVSYVWPLSAQHVLEVTAEGARNTLDQTFRVFFDLDDNGTLEEVAIPTAVAHVEETRGEIFVSHKWAPSEALSVDSSLNFEFSKISNNFPFSPERRLNFLKPRLDARYKLGQSSQLRLLVERTVSQLDFSNFVPSYEVVDQRIEPGNPGLAPEKIWIYEAGFEHRLANDGGVLDFRAFYHQITDHIDKIPFIDQNNNLVSAQGNIADANLYGIEGRASVRLGFIGVPDATLSLRYLRQWSDLIDPFTGDTRRLLDDLGGYSYDASIRHDITPWNMSYGLTLQSKGGEQFISDLTVQQFYTVDPRWTGFIEKRVFGNATLRVEAQNLFGATEIRRRILYATNVLEGTVRRTEQWDETRDLRVAVRLRGLF